MSIGATGTASSSTGTIDEYWLHTPIASTSEAAAGCAVVSSRTPSTRWSHNPPASCSAVPGRWMTVSGRCAVPITWRSSATNTTFRVGVPTSIPIAHATRSMLVAIVVQAQIRGRCARFARARASRRAAVCCQRSVPVGRGRSLAAGWPWVVGVAGVMGRDHCAFAGSRGQCPTFVGLEVVVVRAEGIELVEAGVLGLGPLDPVVVLDELGAGAPGGGAGGGSPPQGGLLCGCGGAAEVGDVDHVDAFGDHELQDRVAEQLPGAGDRDRTEPTDLARLVTLDPATKQCFEIETQDRHVLRGWALLLRVRFIGVGCGSAHGAAGHLDERVERVGLAWFVFAVGSRPLEQFVEDRFVRGFELRLRVDRTAQERLPRAFGIFVLGQAPFGVDPVVPIIGLALRLGAQACLPYVR